MPFVSTDATSTQLLPEASENDDLSHSGSDKADTSYRSLAMVRMTSRD